MFTGIIENVGEVKSISQNGSNVTFLIQSAFTNELKVDQSVAHNGVCLTVEKIEDQMYQVTAIEETLQKSNLGKWQVGTKVNLERSVTASTRIDGHFVQGHVDGIAECKQVENNDGSWSFHFKLISETNNVFVEKGSVAINGVSLTLVDAALENFSVAIIPYTFEHTNFCDLKQGDLVNIEFDILGKYIQKIISKAS